MSSSQQIFYYHQNSYGKVVVPSINNRNKDKIEVPIEAAESFDKAKISIYGKAPNMITFQKETYVLFNLSMQKSRCKVCSYGDGG